MLLIARDHPFIMYAKFVSFWENFMYVLSLLLLFLNISAGLTFQQKILHLMCVLQNIYKHAMQNIKISYWVFQNKHHL